MTEINYKDRKYRDETVFQKINKKYLTLSEEDKKMNNEHLKMMIENSFIPLLKKDELFDALFRRIMYGGSYYKGTKYGKPEEFDLDFVIKLPINYSKITIDTNHDNYGFVKINVDTQGPLHPTWQKHSKILSKWLTWDGYLDQNKFRAWMESVLMTTFLKFPKKDNQFEILYGGKNYTMQHKKSGPAFTVIITTPSGDKLDVDLVPCLEFDNVPLGNGYKKLNGKRKTWMVVGKPMPFIIDSNILWRLCFYEQEKEFLKGDLKPVIRMMKKFRDTKKWKSIASYYIESVLYHELENHKYDEYEFLKTPKTSLFMFALKKLQYYLTIGRLPYFWHSDCNLFAKIHPQLLRSYALDLKKSIDHIDREIVNDPYVLADEVLTEYEALCLKLENVNVHGEGYKSEFEMVPEPQFVPASGPAPSSGYSCTIL